jgi:uncharacterized protein YbjT (DUF2867 family)
VPATIAPALTGIDKVFLYAEPAGAAEFAEAARAAAIEHVVLLSSASIAYPSVRTNSIAERHAIVERTLLNSGVPYTFLRPGLFATNTISRFAPSVRAERVVRTAFPDTESAPIHERDIAEAAVTALLRPGHRNTDYLLSGPESLTARDQVAAIGAALGEAVTLEVVGLRTERAELGKTMPPAFADVMVSFYEPGSGQPAEVHDGVQQITGHPATPFSRWAEDHVADFR